MNKKEKELEWEKFFEAKNIVYQYPRRKQVKINGKSYYSSPSFHLPQYKMYLHVGNESPDKYSGTRDQFIYESAVKSHVYNDVFVTTDIPMDAMNRFSLHSIRNNKLYMPLIEQGKLTFIDRLNKESINILNVELNENNIEEVLSKSYEYTMRNNLKDLDVLLDFHPMNNFTIKKKDGYLGGIRADEFIIMEGFSEDVDSISAGIESYLLREINVDKKLIVVLGNHKGQFCYSLYYYYYEIE